MGGTPALWGWEHKCVSYAYYTRPALLLALTIAPCTAGGGSAGDATPTARSTRRSSAPMSACNTHAVHMHMHAVHMHVHMHMLHVHMHMHVYVCVPRVCRVCAMCNVQCACCSAHACLHRLVHDAVHRAAARQLRCASQHSLLAEADGVRTRSVHGM